MTFGEKLKQARKKQGLTQKELADLSGVGLRSITNYERGTHLPQKEEIYARLAKTLGVSVSSLQDENAVFVMEAGKRYGGRGRKKAEEVIRTFRVAAAGGELDDDDLDFIRDAMMQTYWDAKQYNQRFANHRYQKGDADGQEN